MAEAGAAVTAGRTASGRRRVLAVLATLSGAALLATVLALLLVTRSAVRRAALDLLREETSVAAALHVETGSAEALAAVFGNRVRVSPPPSGELERPVVLEADGGPIARAALYARDRWTVTGTLEMAPRPEATRGLPGWLWGAGAAAALLLAALAALWLKRAEADRHGPAPAAERGGPSSGGDDRRTPGLQRTAGSVRRGGGGLRLLGPALAAGLLLAVVAVSARHWAETHLAELTDLRLEVGAGALTAVPDPEALIGRPGGVTRLTGLAFVDARRPDEVAFSTLLPATARALAALPRPLPKRTVVARAPWAVRGAGGVILAMTPWEHTRDPGGRLLGAVLVGLLLALLPLTLAPLAGRRRELRRNLVAWGFLAPAGLHLAVFTLGPLAFALWLSLHQWSLVDPARPFVGLAHYAGLLRDGAFWNAIGNTAVFTLHVPVAMAVALGFAVLTHRRTRGVTLVRAALFLPSITSLVAIAVVWQWMLNDQYGLLNWALSRVGLEPVPWLTSPATALLSLMLLSTWIVVGYQMVLFQAGLAAIPEELYHAARIDGAGPWRRFWHVTLPGLRHTLFFVLVTSVIGSFQVFGAVYVMTEGGPLGSTDVAVYHIYREAWEFLRFGNAAAMSWILFALIFVVTWLHFRLLERRMREGTA